MAQTSVTVVLNAKDDASQVLTKFGQTASNLGPIVAAAGLAAGAAVVGIGAAATKMAADFDKGMREVGTLFSASEGQLESLKKATLAMSREMGIASDKAVPALYQAISAGVPADNAVDFLRVASTAAIAGVTDLETATDGLTTALNAFQLPASEAGHVADVLFQAVRSGKTTMQEMSQSLFQVAPLAKAAGVGLEETSAAMAALTLGGTPTSVAATQVRAAIQGLIKPSDDLEKIFKKAGFESGQVAIEQRGLAAAMGIVAEAAGGDVGQLTKLVGSVEATQAILALTGSQSEAFASTLNAMTSESGQAQAAFEAMNKSTSRQWEILQNQLNVAMIQLGSALLPSVTEALTAANGMFADVTTRVQGFMDAGLNPLEAILHTIDQLLLEKFGPDASAVFENVTERGGQLFEVLGTGMRWVADVGVPVTIGAIRFMWERTGEFFDSMGTGIRTVGQFFDDFGSGVRRVVDFVTGKIQALDNAVFRAFFGGSIVPTWIRATNILQGETAEAFEAIEETVEETLEATNTAVRATGWMAVAQWGQQMAAMGLSADEFMRVTSQSMAGTAEAIETELEPAVDSVTVAMGTDFRKGATDAASAMIRSKDDSHALANALAFIKEDVLGGPDGLTARIWSYIDALNSIPKEIHTHIIQHFHAGGGGGAPAPGPGPVPPPGEEPPPPEEGEPPPEEPEPEFQRGGWVLGRRPIRAVLHPPEVVVPLGPGGGGGSVIDYDRLADAFVRALGRVRIGADSQGIALLVRDELVRLQGAWSTTGLS